MKLKLPSVSGVAVALFLLFGVPQVFAETVSNSPAGTNTAPPRVTWHTIQLKPREDSHLSRIHFYDKLNPVWWLKNRDEPTPPAWYKPNDKHRKLKWSFRNPMHNFNSYIIGVADKKFARSGRFPERNSDPRGGWDFETTRYKFIWLPYLSYHRPKFEFYFGWRDHGNFGIKININPDRGGKQKPEILATKASARSSPSPPRSGGEGRGEEALRAQGTAALDVRCSGFVGRRSHAQ